MTTASVHSKPLSPHHFVPPNSMKAEALQQVLHQAQVSLLPPGDILFCEGDGSHQIFYLLSGEVELLSPLYPAERLNAQTEAARYPIAHHLSCQVTVRAVNAARVLCINRNILEGARADIAIPKQTVEDWKTRWLQSPLFRRLPQHHLQTMLERMTEITARADEAIVRQDENADSYFVIKSGKCMVSRRPALGAREVKLAELIEGQGFGEEALIANATRNAAVTMLTDGALMRLTKDDFITLVARPLIRQLPYAEAIRRAEQGAVLIDVRTPEEFEIDGLFGSINMPLAVLRLKASRLDRSRHYIVYSNTGQFSCTAAFLLLQEGLEAYVLQGGLSTVPRHRMKHTPAQQGPRTEEPGHVLPFRDPPSTAKTASKDQSKLHADHLIPSWNSIPDEVLWRATVGQREDQQLDALLAPKREAVDLSAQGFGEVHLFTPVSTPNHNPLSLSLDAETGNRWIGSSATAGPGNNWETQLAAYRMRKVWATVGAMILALTVLTAGAYYGYRTGWTQRVAVWWDGQHRLDAKITRLTQLLEALPLPTPPPSP